MRANNSEISYGGITRIRFKGYNLSPQGHPKNYGGKGTNFLAAFCKFVAGYLFF